MGGHRFDGNGCTAAANAAVIVVPVLSSWGDIGFDSDGRTAAANAAVIVALVLSSWGGHRLGSDGRTAAAAAAVIVALVLSSGRELGLGTVALMVPAVQPGPSCRIFPCRGGAALAAGCAPRAVRDR